MLLIVSLMVVVNDYNSCHMERACGLKIFFAFASSSFCEFVAARFAVVIVMIVAEERDLDQQQMVDKIR